MSSNALHSSNVQTVLDLKEALEALPSSERLSNADAETIYGMAYQLVEHSRFESALGYFSLLTLYKPTHPAYLQGLGTCYRALERYEEALNVFSFLAVIDPDNLDHEIAIAECLMLQKDFSEAQRTMSLLLRHFKENNIQTPSSVRASALWELLNHEGKGAATVSA
jgi:tetratricopeptide (TPR) repeat protein